MWPTYCAKGLTFIEFIFQILKLGNCQVCYNESFHFDRTRYNTFNFIDPPYNIYVDIELIIYDASTISKAC